MKLPKAVILTSFLFEEIPILISKSEGAWTCEISDKWEDYKPSKIEDINFEDTLYHFHYSVEMFQWPKFAFDTKRDAVEHAKFINARYLSSKAKIWTL